MNFLKKVSKRIKKQLTQPLCDESEEEISGCVAILPICSCLSHGVTNSRVYESINMFAGSKPQKFHESPNISLSKYQLLCLLFADKINSLLANQQQISQFKLFED